MEKQEKQTPQLELDRNNFETVTLNVYDPNDSEDERISSLFGDKNYAEVNPFVYTKLEENSSSLLNKSKDIALNIISSKKTKIVASASLITLLAVTVGNSISFGSKNNFTADAFPQGKIALQNIEAKKENIKALISSGEIYNESGTVKYQVKNGESLDEISQKANVSKESIKNANHVKDESELMNKDKILVPISDVVVHKVSANETLGSIAIKYKVSVQRILDANKNTLKNPHFLNLDQAIVIPFAETRSLANKGIESTQAPDVKAAKVEVKKPVSRENNIVHKLSSGETMGHLASRYGVSVEKILQSNKNVNPLRLQINQPIIIPVNSINRNGNRGRTFTQASRSLSSSGNRTSGRMVWPARGDYSSGYGQRGRSFHKGIDIAAVHGTKIFAALSGTVIEAGWDYGYGKCIKVRHYNGLVTRYAHCSQMMVYVGQKVEAGDNIALIGSTGHSTGPHLHFEVLVNGVPVNPRRYL